jgi:hypothetical protein
MAPGMRGDRAMTKKHFIEIAKAFKDERPGRNWDLNKLVMWNQLVVAMCAVFARENPRFDTVRFIKACGGLFDMDQRAA